MRKLNLQFFADEPADMDISTGVEVSESAEPTEVEETDENGDLVESATEETTNDVSEPEESHVDVNAIAAAARREAEAKARNAQAQKDAEIVRRYGHIKNCITGQPIRSEADYWAALDAQEQMNTEKELRDKGIDPRMIQEAVNRNPVVAEASRLVEQAKNREVMALIENDVKAISEMDPTIHSFNDVPIEVIEYAKQYQVPLKDAYMVKNYGKVNSSKEEAIRQSTINQAKNKAHLAPVNGVAQTDNSVEIPQELRAMWEEAFPDKTWAERKALYNAQL